MLVFAGLVQCKAPDGANLANIARPILQGLGDEGLQLRFRQFPFCDIGVGATGGFMAITTALLDQFGNFGTNFQRGCEVALFGGFNRHCPSRPQSCRIRQGFAGGIGDQWRKLFCRGMPAGFQRIRGGVLAGIVRSGPTGIGRVIAAASCGGSRIARPPNGGIIAVIGHIRVIGQIILDIAIQHLSVFVDDHDIQSNFLRFQKFLQALGHLWQLTLRRQPQFLALQDRRAKGKLVAISLFPGSFAKHWRGLGTVHAKEGIVVRFARIEAKRDGALLGDLQDFLKFSTLDGKIRHGRSNQIQDKRILWRMKLSVSEC